jgi:photosystem II stability/assembly factor-like uncharacterized protein
MNLFRAGFLVVSFALLLIYGCSKDDKPADPPAPPPPATLPDGWSRVILNKSLLDVFFVDDKTGYVCGENYLAKSTDGGTTWNALTVPLDSVWLFNIFFVDVNTGWAIGNHLKDSKYYIIRTTDGGTSWKKVTLNTSLSDVQFLSKRQGYCISGQQLLLSSDSGSTWKPTGGKLEGGASSLFFLDSATGWLASGKSILFTKDGGQSFSIQQSIPTLGSPVGIHFTDINHGWVPAHDGLYRTTNGGVSWDLLPLNNGSIDVHFFNNNEGYVLNEWGIWKTINGGTSFTKVFNTSGGLIELHFTDPKHGWIVTNGAIYRYVQP